MREGRLPIDAIAPIADVSHTTRYQHLNSDGQTVDHMSQEVRTDNDGEDRFQMGRVGFRHLG